MGVPGFESGPDEKAVDVGLIGASMGCGSGRGFVVVEGAGGGEGLVWTIRPFTGRGQIPQPPSSSEVNPLERAKRGGGMWKVGRMGTWK